jgi:hypothetical protein
MIMTSNRVEMLVNKTYDSMDVGGLYFLHLKKKQRLVSKKGLVTGIKDIVVSIFVFLPRYSPHMQERSLRRAIRLMVFFSADKPADAVLL